MSLVIFGKRIASRLPEMVARIAPGLAAVVAIAAFEWQYLRIHGCKEEARAALEEVAVANSKASKAFKKNTALRAELNAVRTSAQAATQAMVAQRAKMRWTHAIAAVMMQNRHKRTTTAFIRHRVSSELDSNAFDHFYHESNLTKGHLARSLWRVSAKFILAKREARAYKKACVDVRKSWYYLDGTNLDEYSARIEAAQVQAQAAALNRFALLAPLTARTAAASTSAPPVPVKDQPEVPNPAVAPARKTLTLSQALRGHTFQPPANWQELSTDSLPAKLETILEAYKLQVRESNKLPGATVIPEHLLLAEVAFWRAKKRVPLSWLDLPLSDHLARKLSRASRGQANGKGPAVRQVRTHTNGVHTHVHGECPPVPFADLLLLDDFVPLAPSKPKVVTPQPKPKGEVVSLTKIMAEQMAEAAERTEQLASAQVTTVSFADATAKGKAQKPVKLEADKGSMLVLSNKAAKKAAKKELANQDLL